MEANDNRVVVQLVLQIPKYPTHRLINIDDFPLSGVFTEEELDALQAFGSSVRRGQSRPLRPIGRCNVWRLAADRLQCGFAIEHDGAKRLT